MVILSGDMFYYIKLEKMETVKQVFKDEAGNTSSKRVAAFIALIYTLTIYAIRGSDMDYDIFLTLMVFVTSALGISSIEKIKKK